MVCLAGLAFEAADGGDLAGADSDIGLIPRGACAVDDVAVADDKVVGRDRGGGEKEEGQERHIPAV